MKSVGTVVAAVALLASTQEVAAFSSFNGNQLQTGVRSGSTLTMEYIPSGMSKEQWKKMKEKEQNKNKGKNLGATGITKFKSRSFAEWQKAGGINLFPVDPKKVKDVSEIPYMQREGGMPDDSDLKKGKGVGGFFGKKKKAAPAPEPVVEKKKNWWTL
mmetsp:Transcript_8319/g.10023  ORF Transcript_8319/g.10023 Transcript_8319/m.10023 type:complete len:158 (-) Transcript_8319:88-561(-)|eukprot:CAMPEP_0195273400 /NCGR_PEP_ID=MMETSP0706-20130129/16457_1 /TAXON_ID=33640 /ORGANISM="Asterionellopsis glacialis, Strain CCMP134" /LENGTH=157 /DNA_ID=CAMNT_0040329923 /DNA_START=7 /DNA_END=480 /DNA_ORIENTATION=+